MVRLLKKLKKYYMNNKFETDFEYYTNLIKSENNFAYARYADGEVGLMKGNQIGQNSQAYQVDRWTSPNGINMVGERLLESLQHTEDNYHYAISAHSDSIDDYTFLSERIQNPNKTFANLWINSNYQKMYEFYKTLDKSVYIICNHRAKKENFPFKVNEIFPFPDDCIKYWLEYGDDYIVQLIEYVSQLQNETIFVSAGPVSEILIHYMFNANPNNQYIDVGSSIDEFTHGYKTRPYMNPTSQYANETSYFYE
jgi:hypothetical protein